MMKPTITVMARNLGYSVGARVLVLEDLHQLLGLFLGFLLCNTGVSRERAQT